MSGLVPPLPSRKDDNAHDLAAAQKKLSEMSGRPFDVDKILSQQRAKQEREREVGHAAAQKLEKELEKVRQRKNELRAKKVEAENRELRKNSEHIEAEERRLQDKVKNTGENKNPKK